MASFTYNKAKTEFAKGNIDWSTDTFKLALVDSTYTPDKDTQSFFSEVSGEISGGGYTAGGETLASLSVTQDNTDDRAVLDANDVQFTNISDTFRYGILYKSTGTASTSVLLRCIDLEGGDVTLSAGTYDITWPAAGALTLI